MSELAQELVLNKDDVQMMTRQLKEAVHNKCFKAYSRKIGAIFE
ncbi:hypothetical protein [Pseudovibrio sp. Tun.PSC04-5.I4]|nr:hypothetical protein [Pseudovibrio sp. Tun.PSC04-5.I4]